MPIITGIEEHDIEVCALMNGKIGVTTYSFEYGKEITFTISPRQLRLLIEISQDLMHEVESNFVEVRDEPV